MSIPSFRHRLAICGAAALAILSVSITSAAAEEAKSMVPGTFSANIGMVTEYSFRGIQQSDERPAVQGGFDWSHDSGIYLGIWGSSVDFNDGDQAQAEFDLYGGITHEFGKLTLGAGVIYYAYPGAASNLNYNFVEALVSAGYDFGIASAKAQVNYSPNYFGDSDDAVYYAGDVTVPLPLPADLSLKGHVGYQTIDRNANFGVPDYTDWSIGVGMALAGFDLSLSYVDTDLSKSECADGCDARVIFGVSRSF